MAFCSFSDQMAMMDVTPVENMFLLEYMPTAPDGFVRVYLYARMLCIHPELCSDMSEMAHALRMDEDALFNAFAYWEQQGLAQRLTDRPLTYAILPVRSTLPAAMGDMDRDYYKYRDYNASLQEVFGSEYLLHAKQFEQAREWLDLFGLTQDAALRLLKYEYTHGRARTPEAVFKHVHARVIELADQGAKSAEDIQYIIDRDECVMNMAVSVLRQLSINRRPSVNELECVRRWVNEWKLTEDDVLAACALTVKSRQPSIGYLDAILKARRENGEDDRYEAVKQVLRELGAGMTTPTPDQIREYGEILSRGFDAQTVLLAAVQCARKRKNTFEDLKWMLQNWEQEGIRDFASAEKYVSDMQQAVQEMRRLMERAGMNRNPNLEDVRLYNEWRGQYSAELLECAAEFAAGTNKPVFYMKRILEQWKISGITTAQQAKADHAAGKKSAAAPQKHDYQQREYTEADFGKDFFYDPTRDYPKEEN